MSVSRAIREEIEEIDARIAQLQSRRERLLEAHRIVAPEEAEPSLNGLNRSRARSREEWEQEIMIAAASLREFTVAEIAEEIHSPPESVYKYVNGLVGQGELCELDRTGPRNSKMFGVVADVEATHPA